jgi:hypothetical protein
MVENTGQRWPYHRPVPVSPRHQPNTSMDRGS